MASAINILKNERKIIDDKVRDHGLTLLKPYLAKRREIIPQLPQFWSIAVNECEPLRPFIRVEDSIIFDSLNELHVEWDPQNTRSFIIEFDFGENHHFPAQKITKRLDWVSLPENDGFYTSPEAIPIHWKAGSNLIDHSEAFGEESFFTWFDYTNTDNKQERRDNSVIAQIFSEEIFQNALDLYLASEVDQELEEEYDISSENE